MIQTSALTLATEAGRRFAGYLARPSAGRGPGVVILSEMFGLNEPMLAATEAFADRGAAALAPNMFWRSDNTGPLDYEWPDREIAWARLRAFDLDAGCRDIQTAIDWMRKQPFSNGKVAVVGFCGGGRLAFLAAARTDVDGAAALYGLGIAKHLGEFSRVSCPLQIHYGLDDRHIPRSEIDAVSAVARDRPSVTVHRYEGAGHSFFNPVRPTYDAAAAALAAERIDAMLETMR